LIRRREFWGLMLCVLAGVLPAAGWRLESAGEYGLPPEGPEGLSGITWRAGKEFFAVNDRGGLLHRLAIDLDETTGAVTNAVVAPGVVLAGRKDLEGVAWDALRGWVWVSDEADSSVRAYLPAGGAAQARLALPPIYQTCRINASLEALTIAPGGKTLWCCNEEALARGAHGNMPAVDDGPRASTKRGTVVRLQKFSRRDASARWMPAGQWAYVTDSVGGEEFMHRACCGVADLCVLADGTLLVLERELSCKDGLPVPSFRARVYLVDFAQATEISRLGSLRGVAYAPVVKKRLFSANTLFANYEGICRGPRLKDGARCLILVSDGGAGAAKRLLSLKLSRR